MNTLKGKVALVTGASNKKSMGREIAVRLAADGAKVAVVDKFARPKSIWPGDEAWGGLAAVVDEIRSQGSKGLAIEADVSKTEDVDRIVSQTIAKFGKIDILVHCAGVRGPVPVPVVDLDEKIWRMLLDVNLSGSFLLCKSVAKTMIPNGEGKKIVLISSQAGIKGLEGASGYSASKHGVNGLTKVLAMELAKYRINVNAIAPGAFDTNFRDDTVINGAKAQGISVDEALKKSSEREAQMASRIPLGRLGTPEDIANLVSFLVSDQSSYMTGEVINLTGGI